MVILSTFRADFWYAFLAATTLILAAAFTLWMVKRVVFGPVANEKVAELKDVNGRELFVLGTLAAAVLLLGLWPAPLVEVMEPSIQNLAEHIAVSKIGAPPVPVAAADF
jgi:NADH-quinone oxidoreductase subunit M